MKILVFLLVISNFIIALEISDRSTNSVTLINRSDEEKSIQIKNVDAGTIIGEFLISSDERKTIDSLNANSSFAVVSLSNNKNILNFKTLAIEPSENVQRLIKYADESGKLTIKCIKGESENLLVVSGEDAKSWLPIDGTSYKNNPNEKVQIIYNGTYTKEYIQHEGLEFNDYKVFAFSYNGSDGSENYNIDSTVNNPRIMFPKPEPPVALNSEYIRENVFEISWEGYDHVNYYELQVATDESFSNNLEEYDDADVGNSDKFSIYIENLDIDHYWRIRSVTQGGTSEYSNSLRIGTKK